MKTQQITTSDKALSLNRKMKMNYQMILTYLIAHHQDLTLKRFKSSLLLKITNNSSIKETRVRMKESPLHLRNNKLTIYWSCQTQLFQRRINHSKKSLLYIKMKQMFFQPDLTLTTKGTRIHQIFFLLKKITRE